MTTSLKNRLELLSYIQQSEWFKDLERSKLTISDSEDTEDGKDSNPPPEPGKPLEPNEERSYNLVDTKVIKPNRNQLVIPIRRGAKRK